MHTYFNPKRARETYALPDCEVFFEDGKPPFPVHEEGECDECGKEGLITSPDAFHENVQLCLECYVKSMRGWWWWACFPGCLPDGDPMGPFDSEEEALADAREGFDEEDDDEENEEDPKE